VFEKVVQGVALSPVIRVFIEIAEPSIVLLPIHILH